MAANTDDAATAALWGLGLDKPRAEHIAVLYGDDLQRTPFQSTGQTAKAKGAFKIPPGSLRALMHNHPRVNGAKNFSDTDKAQARSLGVPSYISAGDQVFSFDPASGKTEEVLAQFPIEYIQRMRIAETMR